MSQRRGLRLLAQALVPRILRISRGHQALELVALIASPALRVGKVSEWNMLHNVRIPEVYSDRGRQPAAKIPKP